MSITVRQLLIGVSLSIIFGFLLGISLEYPLSRGIHEKAIEICKDHSGWEKIEIKINGNVDSITCTDNSVFVVR